MTSFETPDWSARLLALSTICHELGCDAFVVSSPANLKYLTGFTGSAGLLVVTGKDDVLLVDGRYHTSAIEEQAAGRLTAVRLHLDSCNPCLEKYDLQRTVKAVVARSCSEAAPQDLRDRVLLRIRQVQVEIRTEG